MIDQEKGYRLDEKSTCEAKYGPNAKKADYADYDACWRFPHSLQEMCLKKVIVQFVSQCISELGASSNIDGIVDIDRIVRHVQLQQCVQPCKLIQNIINLSEEGRNLNHHHCNVIRVLVFELHFHRIASHLNYIV